MDILTDYEFLRLAWWVLLGLVLIGFAVMDGFDMGVAILLPFVAQNDIQRRVVINSIGPVWDGNQVWLILGAGAAFAAWPALYATAFSAFYIPLMIVLGALILRPVGFDFRQKILNPVWRGTWDVCLFIGGLFPSFLFGVSMGNLFTGVQYTLDKYMRTTLDGGFILDLLTPFPIMCGLVCVAMMVMHGGTYLVIKTDEKIQMRAKRGVLVASGVLIIGFALAGTMIFNMGGHVITSPITTTGPSNPLLKTVVVQEGGWLNNFYTYPWMITAPVLGFLGALLTPILVLIGRPGLGFIASAFSITGVVATAGLALFPFLLPSRSNPDHGLTIWDSSSSPLTLIIMLVAAVFVLPMIASYTTFVYRVLRGKITTKTIEEHGQNLL